MLLMRYESATVMLLYLRVLLEGPALDIYHRMPIDDANDYDALEEGLLKRY